MTDDELTVRLGDSAGESIRIAGVLLDIRFYVSGRFRYAFSLGRTDGEGVCRTCLAAIERQFAANRRLFLMDYNTPLMDCDALVGIFAPTAGELAERRAARAKWWPEEIQSPDGAANQLVHCPEQKFMLGGGRGQAIELVCERRLVG
jgi:hypothetical protein